MRSLLLHLGQVFTDQRQEGVDQGTVRVPRVTAGHALSGQRAQRTGPPVLGSRPADASDAPAVQALEDIGAGLRPTSDEGQYLAVVLLQEVHPRTGGGERDSSADVGGAGREVASAAAV